MHPSRPVELCFVPSLPSSTLSSSFTPFSATCTTRHTTLSARRNGRPFMNVSPSEDDQPNASSNTPITSPPEPAKRPTPPTTEAASASSSETASKPLEKKSPSLDRSKIELDEEPAYYFGEESLVEPIYLDEVPGKIQLTPEELAEQKRRLTKYSELLRKDRLRTERENARLFGWVKYAETMNGRFAMFFFLTGILTEYWTDYTVPEQIELLLRTLGVI